MVTGRSVPYSLLSRVVTMQNKEDFINDPVFAKLLQGRTGEDAFNAMREQDPQIIWTPHVVECNALLRYLLANFPQWVHWLPMKMADDPELPFGMGRFVGKSAVHTRHQNTLDAHASSDPDRVFAHIEQLGTLALHGDDAVEAAIEALMPSIAHIVARVMMDHHLKEAHRTGGLTVGDDDGDSSSDDSDDDSEADA